jgi:hypothetical protein
VLQSLQLPNPPASIADARLTIDNYAVMNEPREFVIAYHRDTGPGALNAPLFLLRYMKAEKRWIKGRIAANPKTLSGFEVDCLGTSMQISRSGNLLVLDTHLNPSAGCMLVLRENLTLKTSLYGWYLGAFKDGTLLFHNSEVHFAPTHPMEISLYDPARNSTVLIYPPEHDEQRTQFIKALDKAAPDENWCREANSHCDPKRFSSELVDGPAIDDGTRSFGFVARFSSEGYGPKIDKTVGSRDVIYIYRVVPSGMAHREFSFEETERLFGTTPLHELLTPEMLARIFAKQPFSSN